MVQFPTIQVNQKKKRKQSIAWSTMPIMMTMGISAKYLGSNQILQILFIVIFITLFIILIYGIFFIKSYVKIGKITFHGSSIVIEENDQKKEWNFKDINSTEINFAKTWLKNSLPLQLQLGNTWIKFKSGEQNFIYQFLITPEFKFNGFSALCETLHKNLNVSVIVNGKPL